MKTILLTFAFTGLNLIASAQNENKIIMSSCDSIVQTSRIDIKKTIKTKFVFRNQLSPVYFNYRKRQLMDVYKNRISPLEFLDLCRSINDSAVQEQVARYDNFTKNKAKLGLLALGNGVAAFALLGTAVSASEQNDVNVIAPLVFFGVLAIVSVPVIAIYTSVPHKKRKAVLFRDLPVVYNQYVESINQTNN